MSLTCGVNSETETTDHPMFTCHHCGMPVCEQHGWIVTADDAFSGGDGQRSGGTGNISTPMSRAAMHCPKCADDFHKGTDRHHRWADPRAQREGQPDVRAAGRT